MKGGRGTRGYGGATCSRYKVGKQVLFKCCVSSYLQFHNIVMNMDLKHLSFYLFI